jgi:hypothetical protein
LRENKSILIASANKNLGPIRIETEQYIQRGLEHRLDTLTYKLLTKHDAHQDALALKTKIYDWTLCHREALTDDETNFIHHHLAQAKRDPHGYFYLLIKLHKEKISGRPVCSDCGSLPRALGHWVDAQLQPVVKDQALYLKNSDELKGDLDKMTLPANASFFTYDVVAMYPSINTAQCLDRLSGFLLPPDISRQYGIKPKVLLEAIESIMYNNYMCFGNVLVKQISGIAMGMSPAPTLANLFVAIYEDKHILPFTPTVVKYLRHFINNGFGIWLHDPDPAIDESNWKAFQVCLNNSGLLWTFSDCADEAIFMDLRLKIEGRKVVTSLYAKQLALHLYLPPHSCHAPGVLSGLIFGNVLRIHQLCSAAVDIKKELKLFFHRLLDHGCQLQKCTPLFQQAIDNTTAYLNCSALKRLCMKSRKATEGRRQVFLHVPYHPANPPSQVIQRLWHNLVGTPPRQSTTQQAHQLAVVGRPHQQAYHCMALPSQSCQSPLPQEIGALYGAESVVISTIDLTLVCPLIFEQRQSAFGGLLLCSKSNPLILHMLSLSLAFQI